MLRRFFKPRIIAIALIVLFVGMQAIPVWMRQTNPPVVTDVAWTTPEAASIARRACYDCHSNQTNWPWYSRIAPVSWLVTYDVLKGRAELNFSLPLREPEELAAEIAEVLREGEMPPRAYILLHPEANLTLQQKETLIAGTPGATGLRSGEGYGDDDD